LSLSTKGKIAVSALSVACADRRPQPTSDRVVTADPHPLGVRPAGGVAEPSRPPAFPGIQISLEGMAADLMMVEAAESDPALQREIADVRARLAKLTTKLRAKEDKLRAQPVPKPKAAKPAPVAEPAPAEQRRIGSIVQARKPRPRY